MPSILVQTSFEKVRFRCQRCGSCCHHRRPPELCDLVPLEQVEEFVTRSNLISLTKKDILSIGRLTGKDASQFADTLYGYDGSFVKVLDGGKKVVLDIPVLKSKEDTTCIFYQDGCSIYPARPIACRLFPFRVEERSNHRGDTILSITYNENCPGIGKGGIVDGNHLKRMVEDQFLQRSGSIIPQIRCLVIDGTIKADAAIFRTLPGRRGGHRPY